LYYILFYSKWAKRFTAVAALALSLAYIVEIINAIAAGGSSGNASLIVIFSRWEQLFSRSPFSQL